MPARFSTSRGDVDIVPGAASSHTMTVTLNVNPLGNGRMLGVVAMMWTGQSDVTGATFAATFGGTAMSLLGSRTWYTNQSTLKLWILEDVGGGANTITVTVTGMPTELIVRAMHLVSAAYTGYQTVGSLVAAGGTTATSNAVTLTGGVAAGRFLSVHGVRAIFPSFGATSGLRRAEASALLFGDLILQDGPGASSTAMTAAQSSTTDWGALGFPVTASIVDMTASPMALDMDFASGTIGVYDRNVTPSPDRYWRIPMEPGEVVLT